METVFQVCTAAMIAALLSGMLDGRAKEIGTILSMAVCVMILLAAGAYLQPVVAFMNSLEKLGNLNPDITGILLKVAGIGILSEITGLICRDSGNSSLAKAIQILSTIVILWMSIPVYNMLLELIGAILEGV